MIIRFFLLFTFFILSSNLFAQQEPRLQRQRIAAAFEEYLEAAPEDEEIQIRIRSAIEDYESADDKTRNNEIERLKRSLDESLERLERSSSEGPFRNGNISLRQEVRNLVANQAILYALTQTQSVIQEAHRRAMNLLRSRRYQREILSTVLGPIVSAILGTIALTGANQFWQGVGVLYVALSVSRYIGNTLYQMDDYSIMLLNYEHNKENEIPESYFGLERDWISMFEVLFFYDGFILARITGALMYMYSLPTNMIRVLFSNVTRPRQFRNKIKEIFQNISQRKVFSKLMHPIQTYRERQRRILASRQIQALVEFCKEKN